MKIRLMTKKRTKCFHLCGVRDVRLNKQGLQCLVGNRLHDVYNKTHFKDKAKVELEISPDSRVKAYYLCSISKGARYEEYAGIAFTPYDGQNISIDTERFQLEIIGARQINFQESKSSNEPLSQVFAHYLKGLLLQ